MKTINENLEGYTQGMDFCIDMIRIVQMCDKDNEGLIRLKAILRNHQRIVEEIKDK